MSFCDCLMSVNWKCFQCRKGSVEPFHKVNPLELIKFHLASMQALVPWSVTTPQLTITKCHRMAWSTANGTGSCIHLTWICILHPVIQRWISHKRSTSEKQIHPRKLVPSKTSSLGLNGWLVLTLLGQETLDTSCILQTPWSIPPESMEGDDLPNASPSWTSRYQTNECILRCWRGMGCKVDVK